MSEIAKPQEPWTPGTEVISIYNFHGNSKEDLPFKRGEVLTILQATKDPMWYKARHPNGRLGLIPSNYVHKRGEVKLEAMPWFHGKLTRQQAEEKLSPMKDGLFLIRESNNFPGDYTLCVCTDDSIENYHIIYKHNKLTIDEEEFFENLTQLVEHYQKDADGLCTRLKKPVKKTDNFEYFVKKESFAQEGWVIKPQDIKLSDFIGSGFAANVYKAEYLPAKKLVAAKVLKEIKASNQFLKEASLMTSLQHPNLVCLIGVVVEGSIQIITEYMANGSLVEYLRTRGRTVITKQELVNFGSDTARGMAYLEKKEFVHRDLAARNVLVNEKCVAKVSDFGLARPAFGGLEGGHLPIKWTAPEALKQGVFTNKSDMWSFGILLWEIYTFGRVPYPRIPMAEVVRQVEDGYRMGQPNGCPDEIYDIMSRAWHPDPEERPTFREVSQELDEIRKNIAEEEDSGSS